MIERTVPRDGVEQRRSGFQNVLIRRDAREYEDLRERVRGETRGVASLADLHANLEFSLSAFAADEHTAKITVPSLRRLVCSDCGGFNCSLSGFRFRHSDFALD